MSALMKKGKHSLQSTKSAIPAIVMLVLFAILAISLNFVDRQPIAADGSLVGFGTINMAFHDMTGVDWDFYSATEYGGYLAIATMVVFFAAGLSELIKYRSFAKVDPAIYAMTVAYVIMLVLYVAFDKIALNFRPVLVDGILEPSFPSSHTFLAIGTMGCASIWVKARLEKPQSTVIIVVCVLLALFVVVGRLLSGVHWLTDILGGVLLGFALVSAYGCALSRLDRKRL